MTTLQRKGPLPGCHVHNKLLWTNTINAAPTFGQANPYPRYTYNANGEPTQIEHKDAVGGPVITETLKWDGMGRLRLCAFEEGPRRTKSGGRLERPQLGRMNSVANGTSSVCLPFQRCATILTARFNICR